MSHSTIRHGRQDVSREESLVRHVQKLGLNDVEYLDPDEEKDSSDGGLDDPRCYGVPLGGGWDNDPVSNQHYRRGNANFDYIKANWPETIPRHYTWTGEHPVDERMALEGLEQQKGINLMDMPNYGCWVPFTSIYQERTVPFIVTITYSNSNPLLTLSYALLCKRSHFSVVGFKLVPDRSSDMTVVSRWDVICERQRGSTRTVGFRRPPRQRRHEWSAEGCEWLVPGDDHSLRDRLHISPDEVARMSARSSREAGHRHAHCTKMSHSTSRDREPHISRNWVNDEDEKPYARGHPHYDFIRAYWPATIPNHYYWRNAWSRHEERQALSNLEGITCINLFRDPYTIGSSFHLGESTYQQDTGPYIVTITYNQEYTLSYALLRKCGELGHSVVGFELYPDHIPTPVSRWEVIFAERRNVSRTTSLERPFTRLSEWMCPECLWVVPNYPYRERCYYPADPIVQYDQM